MDKITDAYFDWLYALVLPMTTVKNPSRSYSQLLEVLINIDFNWTVPNDDNRVMDALELRYEFVNSPPISQNQTCTFLEMLIALSRRASFQSSGDVDDWFWHILSNIGIGRQFSDDDRFSLVLMDDLEERVYRVIFREYDEDGSNGGLFPLNHPVQDQRKVELWYQLAAYILEGKGPGN